MATLPYFAQLDNPDKPVDDDTLQSSLLDAMHAALKEIGAGVNKGYGMQGGGIYVGLSGIALVELRIAEVLSRTGIKSRYEDMTPELMETQARKTCDLAVKLCAQGHESQRLSFLEGLPGPLALQASLQHRAGHASEAQQAAKAVEGYLSDVRRMHSSECEVLYGRAGYLYALLYLRHHLGTSAVNATSVRDVVEQIIEEGKRVANSQPELQKFGLMYEWHGKCYLGAAHGLVGILHTLLLCYEDVVAVCGGEAQASALLMQAVNALLEERFPSGNLKSSLGSDKDRLVQWCHGAPGLLLLLAKVQEVLLKGQPDPAITQAAKKAGEEVWKRGLLKKGVGLCHGISGNGYSLLALYRMTHDPLHLRQAQHFGQVAALRYIELLEVPDRGLSLYEVQDTTMLCLPWAWRVQRATGRTCWTPWQQGSQDLTCEQQELPPESLRLIPLEGCWAKVGNQHDDMPAKHVL